jgi:hypothetical protein
MTRMAMEENSFSSVQDIRISLSKTVIGLDVFENAVLMTLKEVPQALSLAVASSV